MKLTIQQHNALRFPCRLAIETFHPRFARKYDGYSIVLSVNSGYEWLVEGYGGPVWHASAAPLGGIALPEASLRQRALEALDGVGDAQLGQWEEYTGYAYHIRRRLNAEEQAKVGDVCDIRGTPE